MKGNAGLRFVSPPRRTGFVFDYTFGSYCGCFKTSSEVAEGLTVSRKLSRVDLAFLPVRELSGKSPLQRANGGVT
jgi:hypothetical protein